MPFQFGRILSLVSMSTMDLLVAQRRSLRLRLTLRAGVGYTKVPKRLGAPDAMAVVSGVPWMVGGGPASESELTC